MLKKFQCWKLWLTAPAALLWMQSTQAADLQALPAQTTSAIPPTTEPIVAKPAAPIQTLKSEPAKLNAASVQNVKSDTVTSGSNLEQISNVSQLEKPENPEDTAMSQVTSISQLSDVRPTDWAFQALQSLVERYGCIAGYPDKTFRGNRALTRYEFAAGLNACLDRVNELIAASTANLVRKQDLLTLQKLQEEFAAELAALRGRVDSLEARATTLERQQFSTTTKLFGNVWINLTGATGGGRNVQYEGPAGSENNTEGRFFATRTGGQPTRLIAQNPQITESFLAWLTLVTSFTGRDQLVTQLAAGNGISPYNLYASAGFYNASGVPFFDQSAGIQNGRSDFVIRDLFYSFPVGESVKVTVGPRINWYRHFDGNRFLSIFNAGASFDTSNSTQSNSIDRGSGAVVEWNINPQFRFAVGYLGENTEFLNSQFRFNTSNDPTFGLFGGTNTSSAELTYSPSRDFSVRLQYNYSRIQAYGGQVGGAIGEPIPYGYLDAGPGFSEGGIGGGLKYATAHMFGVNFDWLVTPGFGLFGRYSYAITRLNPTDDIVNTQSFQAGFALPDFGKKGAQATVAFVMPMDILRGRGSFAAGGGNGGTQYELEASYFYPLTKNIAVVPTFYAIFSPNNFGTNPTVYVGNIRTQFSF